MHLENCRQGRCFDLPGLFGAVGDRPDWSKQCHCLKKTNFTFNR